MMFPFALGGWFHVWVGVPFWLGLLLVGHCVAVWAWGGVMVYRAFTFARVRRRASRAGVSFGPGLP